MYLQYLQFSKILDFLHCFAGIHILQTERKLHNSSEHKQLLNRDRLLILTYWCKDYSALKGSKTTHFTIRFVGLYQKLQMFCDVSHKLDIAHFHSFPDLGHKNKWAAVITAFVFTLLLLLQHILRSVTSSPHVFSVTSKCTLTYTAKFWFFFLLSLK